MSHERHQARMRRLNDEAAVRKTLVEVADLTAVRFQQILERSRPLVGGPNVADDIAAQIRADRNLEDQS